VSIGRDETCDIQLFDNRVSSIHAVIEQRGSTAVITDQDSKNGTSINGKQLVGGEPIEALDGAEVRIGGHKLFLSFNNGGPELRGSQPKVTGIIGRDPNCEIFIDSLSVSRKHAKLSEHKGSWKIEDLGSQNGTFVNGERIKERDLVVGDQIKIGTNLFSLTQFGIGGKNHTSSTVVVQARNLSQVVQSGNQSLKIMRNITLSFYRNELVAILGESGSGKTTLLMALNGYQPASSGKVLVEDEDIYLNPTLFRTAIGYVPQGDIVHQELTVIEALRFAAMLRLPPDTTYKEVNKLVTQVLTELDLTRRKNHIIQKLSGGERKRVNIAVELLTRPTLLFLDEPTSALDAGLERRVVQLLRSLADEGRTVVTVTHSISTIDMFDRVVVLSRGGYLAFSGAPDEALKFFGVKDYVNLYECLTDPSIPAGYWAERFQRKSEAVSLDEKKNNRQTRTSYIRKHLSKGSSAIGQFLTLMGRYGAIVARDKRNVWIWALQIPVIALLIVLIFKPEVFSKSQVPDSSGHFPIMDGPSIFFLMSFSIFCFSLFTSAKEIVKERLILEREQHIGLRMGPYLASKFVMLSAVAFIQAMLLFALIELGIGFHLSSEANLKMALMLFLGAINATALGLLISTASKNSDQATTMSAGIIMLQVVLSGLVPLEKMPAILHGASNVSALRWTYGSIAAIAELPAAYGRLPVKPKVSEVLSTDVSTGMWSLVTLLALLIGANWMILNFRNNRI
jgi:ABC-type multidrug transport system ATPase subunit